MRLPQAAGLQEQAEIRMRLSIMTGLHVKLQDQAAAFGSMRARRATQPCAAAALPCTLAGSPVWPAQGTNACTSVRCACE